MQPTKGPYSLGVEAMRLIPLEVGVMAVVNGCRSLEEEHSPRLSDKGGASI
jgi:hypothetical protein